MRFQTAYPTLGEFIRFIAGVLESKPKETNDSSDPLYRMAKNLDRLVDNAITGELLTHPPPEY